MPASKIRADTPTKEAQRLAALKAYRIRDTGTEQAYEVITGSERNIWAFPRSAVETGCGGGHCDYWPMVAAPPMTMMLIGLEMVMVSELEPAVLMIMVPYALTALVPPARVLKGWL